MFSAMSCVAESKKIGQCIKMQFKNVLLWNSNACNDDFLWILL